MLVVSESAVTPESFALINVEGFVYAHHLYNLLAQKAKNTSTIQMILNQQILTVQYDLALFLSNTKTTK